MAPPGSLEVRYRQLAGDEGRRSELYLARRWLGYSVDEWRALPWWQRRMYLEQANLEIEARSGKGGGSPSDAQGGIDAILNGTMDDVSRATGYSTS